MIVPEGKIAIGKLAQALIHGARVVALKGNFDDALRIVRELTQKHPIELVNSVNPYRIEGQKTGAFEVIRGGEARAQMIALNRENPAAVDERFLGLKPALEEAVKDHSAL